MYKFFLCSHTTLRDFLVIGVRIFSSNKANYIFLPEQMLFQQVLQQCNLPSWIYRQGIQVYVSGWLHGEAL